jgi:hypothetical protein
LKELSSFKETKGTRRSPMTPYSKGKKQEKTVGLFCFRKLIIYPNGIMEKGDKPKPKPLKKDKKVKKQKKPKVKQQEQKQEQKQNVKIVIGETKPKRKYVRKPKAPTRPSVNIVRGQTAVSYLGGEADVNQVITGTAPSRQNIQQATAPQPRGGNPPPQPPILSQVQAPTTLDTELTATSELMYPVARTPAFEERKKKLVVKKKKPIFIKISDGIGDFIKQNLLDQPLDLHTQEPSRTNEMPNPPLTIQPESYPDIIKIKPVKKVKAKDIPIESKYAVEQAMKAEIEQMGMQDVNVIPNVKPVEEKQVEELVVKPYKSFEDKEKERYLELKARQEKGEKLRQIDETFVYWEDYKRRLLPDQQESVEVISIEDQPLSKEDLNQSLRQMIVADKIDDMISTIETPVFSENQDFKTISQSVEVDNVPSNELDFGDEGLTQFNIDGFVPVGKTEGMEEVIIKKKGRQKKYENPELAKQMKNLQTRESYRRLADQRKAKRELMEQEEKRTKQIDLNKEWEDFTALEQETDDIRYLIETIKEQKRQEEQNPYSYEKLNPNAPKIYVAEEERTIMLDIGKPKSIQGIQQINREAYNSDFISGDFNQQIGDLFSTNNFSMLKPMVGSELGYSDENPVLTTALFSEDAVDSNLPFLSLADIQFV